ncbi:MAG: septal ring lytic transglycosylase RlpA family protein [Sphingomonadaceae bacterium]|nr:septal ring lytic transglycosylase RlpA family protein [Sphingomonadaceae bacterium]
MMQTNHSPLSRTARIALIAALAAAPFGSALAETGAENANGTAFEAVPVVQPLPAPETLPAPEAAPAAPATRAFGTGMASFYGAELHGRRTASGERFDMHALTAAHRTLPFGTRVLVTNPANGRSVTVRINDRGPFHGGRVIDLSRAAASEIGLVARGYGRVELALVEG